MAQPPVNCVVLLSLFLWVSVNMCLCVCVHKHTTQYTHKIVCTQTVPIEGSLDTPTHSLTSEKQSPLV